MTKKEKFIKTIEEAFFQKVDMSELDPDVVAYWNNLKSQEEVEKPMFTDNGKLILQYLKDHPETTMWKSKDIAEGLFISSRAVSGTMRKLVTDGFVEKEKNGSETVIYSITEKGKEIEII